MAALLTVEGHALALEGFIMAGLIACHDSHRPITRGWQARAARQRRHREPQKSRRARAPKHQK